MEKISLTSFFKMHINPLIILYIISFLFLIQSNKIFGANYFIDKNVSNFPLNEFLQKTHELKNDFFVFTHGKPGKLLINGQWLSDEKLEKWLKLHSKGNSIRIYSCDFGKGIVGKTALNSLTKNLKVNISASDDITGIDGDWDLEVGNRFSTLYLNHFYGNLQCTNYWAIDDCDGDGIENGVDFDCDNDGILDTEEGCFDSWATGDSVVISGTPNPTRISFTFGTPGFPTLYPNNNQNMIRLMTTPSLNITAMSAGSGLIMVNGASTSLSISEVTATSYAESISNNEYITFSFTTDNIYSTSNIDYVGFLNRIDQAAFSVTYSISSDGGNTLTELATFNEAINDGGGTFPQGVENGITYPYQILPNVTYQVRIYFYGFPNGSEIIDFDDVYVAFDVCNLDTDKDGIADYIDRDSDNDGCPDAIEGDENVISDNLNSDNSINTSSTGGVNSNGIPNIVNPGFSGDIGGDIAQGRGYSRISVLTNITASPVDQNVVAGNSAIFTVSATADSVIVFNNPPPHTVVSVNSKIIYQWQLSIDGGNSWTNISGANSSSYTTPITTLSMNSYQYRVVISHIANACPLVSSAAILSVSNPLPLSLIDFHINRNNKDAILKWYSKDVSLINYFEIERSTNSNNFKTIEIITKKEFTNSEQNYEFIDKNILNNFKTVYYRIKQVDLDGNYLYSDIKTLSAENYIEEIKLYPNPTNSILKFNKYLDNAIFVIYNTNGERVLTQKISSDFIDVSELPNNIYFIRIVDKFGMEILVQHFIKIDDI